MPDPTSTVDPSPRRESRGPLTPETGSWIPVVVGAAVLAMTLVQVLAFNDGVLVYSMDDPYIGYALAEEIAKGNYGINPGEVSSPASTILWPFLLAPLLLLPGGLWIPLLINAACALLIVHVTYGSIASSLRDGGSGAWRALATTGALASILLSSLVFITFAGMEHGPQVLLAALVTVGLIDLFRDSTALPSKLLLGALVLGPLIRFEAMALTAPALVLLWLRGHRRQAVAVCLGTMVPIAAFVAFLMSQGVGPLPSSLLIRAPHAAGANPLAGILANVALALRTREGVIMATLMIPLLGVSLSRKREEAERRLGLWLVAAVLLHYMFGQFGYWGRYEAYIWTVSLIAVPYLLRRDLASWMTSVGTPTALPVAGLLLWFVGHDDAAVALRTPLASNDIYLEHREMNRLVTDFIRAPVGVNDVGYVAFRNDHYVLDLFGLTSHEIRSLRLNAGPETAWMDELVREHEVDFVMIYMTFFQRVPSSWTPLARLQTERLKALVDFRTVTLFATRPEVVPELRAKLAEFAEGLPRGMTLEFATRVLPYGGGPGGA